MSSKRTEIAKLFEQANLALKQNQPQAAGPLLQRILALDPNHIDAAEQLGLAAFQTQQFQLAENIWSRVLQADPKRTRARYMLACMYSEIRREEDAIQHFTKLIEIQPSMIAAYNNLGVIYKNREQYNKAAKCFEKVVKKEPKSAFALSNLGNVLKESGRFEEAVKKLEAAVRAEPTLSAVFSNLLISLNYRGFWSPHEDYKKHCEWIKHLPRHIKHERYDFNTPERIARSEAVKRKEQNLKVGFLSPDLHRHSVSYFMSPLLKQLKESDLDCHVYYTNTIRDDVQKRLETYVTSWNHASEESDEALADRIFEDEIDVLIDLAGHTANNRLAVFAQKPSPVQITWLGYPNTTGLKMMDYRLVDQITDPLPEAQQLCTEKLVHIPEIFLCFEPPERAPEVNESPCLKQGYVTFGSFNNLNKVGEESIAAWSKLLIGVPNSRLIIKARQLGDDETRAAITSKFVKEGIAAERLELVSFVPDITNHLSIYNRVDIALDTYPYNGTTTTCEALWMGVPVMAMKGNCHASRVGASILSSVGLDSLVFDNLEEMVDQALNWSHNADGFNKLRMNIREKVSASPLCDSDKFSVEFERIIRGLV